MEAYLLLVSTERSVSIGSTAWLLAIALCRFWQAAPHLTDPPKSDRASEIQILARNTNFDNNVKNRRKLQIFEIRYLSF